MIVEVVTPHLWTRVRLPASPPQSHEPLCLKRFTQASWQVGHAPDTRGERQAAAPSPSEGAERAALSGRRSKAPPVGTVPNDSAAHSPCNVHPRPRVARRQSAYRLLGREYFQRLE